MSEQIRELMRRVKDLESDNRSRGSQLIRVGTTARSNKTEDDSSGTGGGGCCCNEFDCLRAPDLPDGITLKPEYYEFTPSNLACGCSVDYYGATATVRLYQVDPGDDTIWESLHGEDDDPPMCLGTQEETVPCTVTASWEWVHDAVCGGECTYVCQRDPELFFTYRWQKLSDTCDPDCECDEIAVFAELDGMLCNLGNDGVERTYGDCLGGHWVLVSVDDADCDCTPVEPDYDGTEEGQTAETSCEGTKVVDSSEALLPAFWRLTIVEALDYYGCDSTKLEFIVGINVVLTYRLGNQGCNAKPFCRTCVNSFRLNTCVPRCTDGPTVICLTPSGFGYVDLSASTCFPPQLPYAFKITITDAPDDLTCTNDGITPPAVYAGDAATLNASYLLLMTVHTYDPACGGSVCRHFEWEGTTGDWTLKIVAREHNTIPNCEAVLYVISRQHVVCGGGTPADVVAADAAFPFSAFFSTPLSMASAWTTYQVGLDSINLTIEHYLSP